MTKSIAQRIMHSSSTNEIAELFVGIAARTLDLEPFKPLQMVTVDNCCSVRRILTEAFDDFAREHATRSNVTVVLDLWHFKQRYMTTVSRNTANRYYQTVSAELTGALIDDRVDRSRPSQFRPIADQVERLQAWFDEFATINGVWTIESHQTHKVQVRCRCSFGRCRADPLGSSNMSSSAACSARLVPKTCLPTRAETRTCTSTGTWSGGTTPADLPTCSGSVTIGCYAITCAVQQGSS